MLRRITIICGSLAVILVAGGLIVHQVTSPWKPHVSLSFSAYTNDNSGTRVATFILSNRSSATIRATPFCDRVDRQHKMLEPRPLLLGETVLVPGKLWVFSVPAPAGQEPWKLSLLCSCEGLRSTFGDWVGRSPRVRARIPRKWYGVPSDFVESDWVER
jgi:hypothetical protein